MDAGRAADDVAARDVVTMWSTTASMPTLCLACANTTGPPLRILCASRSITDRSAPTSGARSVLLMTRQVGLRDARPPFAGDLVAARHVDHVDRVATATGVSLPEEH